MPSDTNLYSCIHHLGNQCYIHTQGDRCHPGKKRLNHKMANNQVKQLKGNVSWITQGMENDDLEAINGRFIYLCSFFHHPGNLLHSGRHKILPCWYTLHWGHIHLFQDLHTHRNLNRKFVKRYSSTLNIRKNCANHNTEKITTESQITNQVLTSRRRTYFMPQKSSEASKMTHNVLIVITVFRYLYMYFRRPQIL